MDEEGDSPQFWLHSASTGASIHQKPSPKFFNSTTFMLIVAIPASLLFVLAFSSFPPFTSQILKPSSVRKSWDSINVLLVLFAIVCGIFARWNEDVGSNTNKELEIPVEQVSDDIPLQQPSSPTSSYELRWYELSYESQIRTTARGSGRLRRNSSSYPDLRQQSDWETTEVHGFRYYDDFEVSKFNQTREIQTNGVVSGRRITRGNGDPCEKVIPVDTHLNHPNSSAKSSSPQDNPPSQPPRAPPSTQQKKTRIRRSVPKQERSGIENAPQAAHQQPKNQEKGSSNPLKNGLTPQTKPRRRKAGMDVPVKEDTYTRSASESSSNPAPPQPPPPLHPITIPIEEKYTRQTPDPISRLHPPSPPKPPKATQTAQMHESKITTETKTAPFSSPSPPRPPSTPIRPDQNQNSSKKEKKKRSARKEIAMVWASIYKRKKKLNQPQQQQLGRADSGNFNGISQLFSEPESDCNDFTSTSQHFPPPSPAPPPPPPPPPHSVFHSLFKKSSTTKSKKIHSVTAPPPPPPPPPRQTFTSPPPDTISQPRTSTGKPPLPNRPINHTKSEYRYQTNSGSQSPLFDIPRPPPLPPFGVPYTKFVVRGDYAKIKSDTSSRNGSPEPYAFDDDDDVESLMNDSVGGDVARDTASYCPSPDVNAKADNFIARLRGEWRLEKLNSVNEKTATRMGL